jgi:hypothetical protein
MKRTLFFWSLRMFQSRSDVPGEGAVSKWAFAEARPAPARPSNSFRAIPSHTLSNPGR